MNSKTTLMMVPSFAGAPWHLDQFHQLKDWPMRTMRLPEHLDELGKLDDFVLARAWDTGSSVVVGDLLGAVISIAASVRQPRGLAGLVLSGGFAKNPISSSAIGVFVQETAHRAYANWVHAVDRADYTAQLSKISVPTLILTPEDDCLVGKDAADILLTGIRQSRQVVMPQTGHMFRFPHPGQYSEAVQMFLQSNIPAIGGAQ